MESFTQYITESNKKMVDDHMRKVENMKGADFVKKHDKELRKKISSVVKNLRPGTTSQGKDYKQLQWDDIVRWIKKSTKK
jgi:hypothetical protein